VSIIVLVGFVARLLLVNHEEVPANQRDMVTLLLGTLAGMASSVVAYWVGSSNGSMQMNTAHSQVGKPAISACKADSPFELDRLNQ
jgi:hypothetical protein